MFTKKILVDLDGVLNEYDKFDENFIPKIKDGLSVGHTCPTITKNKRLQDWGFYPNKILI